MPCASAHFAFQNDLFINRLHISAFVYFVDNPLDQSCPVVGCTEIAAVVTGAIAMSLSVTLHLYVIYLYLYLYNSLYALLIMFIGYFPFLAAT